MILVSRELKTELTQEFNLLLDKRHHVREVSVYLLMYNSPSGEFTFEILKGSEVVYSYEFTSQDIKTALGTTDDYAHLFLPMPANFSLSRGTYIAKLSADNYTYLSSSFLGWVNDWEGFKFDQITEQALERPNALRLITYDDPNT